MKNYQIFVSFLMFMSLSIVAQTKVGYYYDNNGNRYQRYFIGLRPAGQDSAAAVDSVLNAPPQTNPNNSKDPQTLAFEYGVKVYPNPTKDIIMVDITRAGEKESKKADMFLIDNTGKIIDRKKYSGTEISFDLSKSPPGNYFLKIIFDDQSKLSYNVVKVN